MKKQASEIADSVLQKVAYITQEHIQAAMAGEGPPERAITQNEIEGFRRLGRKNAYQDYGPISGMFQGIKRMNRRGRVNRQGEYNKGIAEIAQQGYVPEVLPEGVSLEHLVQNEATGARPGASPLDAARANALRNELSSHHRQQAIIRGLTGGLQETADYDEEDPRTGREVAGDLAVNTARNMATEMANAARMAREQGTEVVDLHNRGYGHLGDRMSRYYRE